MVRLVEQTYTAYGLTNYFQKFCSQCLVCAKNNPQGNYKIKPGSFPKPTYPFEQIEMDFIELTKCEGKKYALVIIDKFSSWVEIFPVGHPDATSVAKALCREIIPRFGIPEKIYCDNGTHFVNEIIAKLTQKLEIQVKYHCAYHPQSAGFVERANQTIKSKLRKAMTETEKNWVYCLPLVLQSMHITPSKDGVSPFEILYGRPYVIPNFRHTPATEAEDTLADYMRKTLACKEVKSKVLPPYMCDVVAEPESDLKPGDLVLIKVFRRKRWSDPRWEGPHVVLLTTPTAVRVEGRTTWIHKTHCKRVPLVGE